MLASDSILFAAGGASSLAPLIPMFLVFLVLYFLIIRPQSRRQKEREAMLKSVQKGQRILTTSGMYGTIVSTRDNDILIVKVAENVRLEMARSAVAQVLGEEGA